MNKICLDKLCEFSMSSYINNINNINYNNKYNLEEVLNNIKQNFSLNEKGLFSNLNFTEFNNLIKNIQYNELVLLNPLSFNIYGNKEWFNFLNAILTILNDKYIFENNIKKKIILENTDKIYKKKIIINDFNDKLIENVCKLTNVSILIISNQSVKKYNLNTEKYLILFKHNNEYYPFINWDLKYYYNNDNFVNYILNDLKFVEEKFNNFDIEEKDNNKNYQELTINENFALDFSEVVDNNNILINDNNKSDKSKNNDIIITNKTLKKNKKKDIFVINNDVNNKIEEETSVFKKTEIINKNDVDEIKNNLKLSLLIADLQKYAIKLKINIANGSNKNGKPKLKTKKELYDEIKLEIEKN